MYKIRGEYWVIDGHVDFADGDVGDRNHEMIATEHIVNEHLSNIVSLAEELNVDTESINDNGEVDTYAVSNVLESIFEALIEQNKDEKSAVAYIVQYLNVDNEAYEVLVGRGDARYYVIKHYGWLAVRSNNVELYGYDASKQRVVANAIRDVMYEEGGVEDGEDDTEIAIYDFKTGKSWYTTLEELEQPNISIKTNQQANTTYNKSFFHGTNPRDEEENKYAQTTKTNLNKFNAQAQQQGIVGPGQQVWRGTSESLQFGKWFRDRKTA